MTSINDLIKAATAEFDTLFEQMYWSEDEIAAAQQRHPHKTDLLHHSFSLLTPSRGRMDTEFVYRGHCRELLNRVARGDDTTIGTAAEVAVDLLDVAKATPLNPTAEGLVFRMWREAFPDYEVDGKQHHREELNGAAIDEEENIVRRKLIDPHRVLDGIDCNGRHHGEPVTCSYATVSRSSHALAGTTGKS